MSSTMASDSLAGRRAKLRASRRRWSKTDRFEIGRSNEDIVQPWLQSASKVKTKAEVALEMTVNAVRANDGKDDDLVLGAEASLYGKRFHRSVWRFRRSSQELPALSRWNSFASVLSTQSEFSVMDVLNMLQDDPEELLLDLGFGVDEPDITGRIPARFLSYQSNARGINFQVFLDAQQSRIDVENPDVRSRFRQLEVLQQVTSTFSNLVGSSAQNPDASSASQMSVEKRERRKRFASILRRAAKKTLSQTQTSQDTSPPATSAQSGPEALADERIPLKLSHNSNLSPLAEEQNVRLEAAEIPPHTSVTTQNLKLNSVPSAGRKGAREPLESFELEEIQSFDDGSGSGNFSGPVDPGGEHLVSYVKRTNSCQSDSSGFLEEPFVPALSQHNSPGSDLRKILNGISQDNTKGQQRSVEHTQSPAKTQSSETQFTHTDSPTTHSLNSVLKTANCKTVHDTADSHTVLRTADSDSSRMSKILSEKEKSDSLSADISKVVHDGVYSVAYFVQMDPTSYQTEICDRLQSSNPGICKRSMSLYEELKSAESISHVSADLGTGVETCEQVLFSGTSVSDQIQEHPASAQDETSEDAAGQNSPVALERRRETFSKTSWSDAVVDSDSGMVQTSTTHSPFGSVETSPPHLWNSEEDSRDLGCLRMRSMSLDTGLTHEEEDHRWQCALWAGTQRCFHCGSPIVYDSSWVKTRTELSSDLPYSLDELENMMKSMRKFQTVLTEIEARLDEEQASVIGSLSESHREEVEDVLRLRASVRQEAGVLEQQLSDLVHHYDDSIKMKLNRLLDEQSELCSQLQISPSDPARSEPPSTRSVAVQCCLPPVTSSPQRCCHHHCSCHTHVRMWPDTHRPPCHTQWDSNFTPDRLDFVAFIKSLKNSLQLSIKNSSLE